MYCAILCYRGIGLLNKNSTALKFVELRSLGSPATIGTLLSLLKLFPKSNNKKCYAVIRILFFFLIRGSNANHNAVFYLVQMNHFSRCLGP